ncbi:hypothetical protein GCM10010468_47850 [Actinocorallia longicatena]|uniref:Uncharacterized protein n=1 Tax=Actinocorallia longicatena TaxID=111803 RepID=A0ABP6QEQ4_9ACTN
MIRKPATFRGWMSCQRHRTAIWRDEFTAEWHLDVLVAVEVVVEVLAKGTFPQASEVPAVLDGARIFTEGGRTEGTR